MYFVALSGYKEIGGLGSLFEQAFVTQQILWTISILLFKRFQFVTKNFIKL